MHADAHGHLGLAAADRTFGQLHAVQGMRGDDLLRSAADFSVGEQTYLTSGPKRLNIDLVSGPARTLLSDVRRLEPRIDSSPTIDKQPRKQEYRHREQHHENGHRPAIGTMCTSKACDPKVWVPPNT
ncbi:hypothetical protein Aple_063520 [Acrocarpospora pleiomorpha]|uniref:Uncharacterized protein n=1 Tax=Acrocarpospora pleiomorpha TaxID=90975 RepID=A0A5M3XVU5_9ACTN|nr:hypothetical protein Aple_063520 [Acrocarpospora pleiomorpha]